MMTMMWPPASRGDNADDDHHQIHALVDANGLPVMLKLTAGQAHDGRSAADMLSSIREGQVLLADRAYDSDALRAELAEHGAWANIPSIPSRKSPLPFNALLYRYRNLVECFFNKLKHFRAIATRYEKHAENYLALVKLASVRIWLRVNESVAYRASTTSSDGDDRAEERQAILRLGPRLPDEQRLKSEKSCEDQ
jgi:transposase